MDEMNEQTTQVKADRNFRNVSLLIDSKPKRQEKEVD